ARGRRGLGRAAVAHERHRPGGARELRERGRPGGARRQRRRKSWSLEHRDRGCRRQPRRSRGVRQRLARDGRRQRREGRLRRARHGQPSPRAGTARGRARPRRASRLPRRARHRHAHRPHRRRAGAARRSTAAMSRQKLLDLGAAVAVAATVVATPMAGWTWIVHDGVYARIVACGFGAWAWYAHERWRASDSRGWLVVAAALLAATVASHAFMGLVFAGVVALRTLPRLFALARIGGLALLIGAPAWLPAAASGAGSFFGAFHGAQVLSPIEVLWVPAHVGPAAPLFFAFA